MAEQTSSKSFPKWKYPADGAAGRIVNNAEEEQALSQSGRRARAAGNGRGDHFDRGPRVGGRRDRGDEELPTLARREDPTRAECIEYNLHQSDENPAEFTFYESWTSRAGWDLHMTRPYVQEIAHRAKELLAVRPQIRLMRTISKRATK